MPFKSKAQRRWMYANEPEMAKRWSEHTAKGAKLPEYVKEKKAFMNTTQQAYINGFVKRASEYGVSQEEAFTLLKRAETDAEALVRLNAARGVSSSLGTYAGYDRPPGADRITSGEALRAQDNGPAGYKGVVQQKPSVEADQNDLASYRGYTPPPAAATVPPVSMPSRQSLLNSPAARIQDPNTANPFNLPATPMVPKHSGVSPNLVPRPRRV